MLSHPACTVVAWSVTKRRVRTISRKGLQAAHGLRRSRRMSVITWPASRTEKEASTRPSVPGTITGYRGKFRCHSIFLSGTRRCRGSSRQCLDAGLCVGADGVCYFEVTDLIQILERVIPFFERFRLLSGKTRDFETFRRIAELMSQKAHLTREGIAAIVRLRSPMNRGGKRRYPDQVILDSLRLKESSEAIRQAPVTYTG